MNTAAAKMTGTKAVVVSLVLSGCVIANAFRQKKQFYPSVVYICKSNPSMTVMYMQAMVAVYLLGKLIGRIFFGTLRAAESERLIEKAWYAVTETCLAFTIFKDDLSPKFIALFTLLLFLKCFHWLAEDRVDYMERTPVISYLFHVRIWLLLTILSCGDIYFVHDAYTTTIVKGPSVQLVFGFEYALLITLAANAAFKYVLHSVDIHSDTFWERKAVLMLYLEFFIGLCKASMYVVFLIIMIRTYTIPLFAFRPMYHTLRNFKKVFQDLILSRRAIHNMNTLYPDATIEDLQAIENVCIICREDMVATASKKLPCNHIFHKSCLRSWFQKHQTCPTCRLDILRQNITPQPSVAAAPPAPQPRTAQTTADSTTDLPPVADDNQRLAPNNRPSVSGPSNSQNNLQYTFKPFQQQPTHIDENNTNNSNVMNNENGFIQLNESNEAWTSFMDTTFPSNSQTNSSFNSTPPFSTNLPFVGGLAIQLPQMPANLDSLSDEELRLMEQNTRQGCIARLKYVTDIKCMLDSAVLLMNHYSTAYLIASHDGTSGFKTTSDTSENDEQLDSSQTSFASQSPTASEMGASGSKVMNSSSSSSSNSNSDQLQPDETEAQRLVRIKRMEKFGNSTQ